MSKFTLSNDLKKYNEYIDEFIYMSGWFEDSSSFKLWWIILKHNNHSIWAFMDEENVIYPLPQFTAKIVCDIVDKEKVDIYWWWPYSELFNWYYLNNSLNYQTSHI